MTSVQWLFHYMEIIKFRSDKVNADTDLITQLVKWINSNTEFLANSIIDGAKIAGSMANPEAGKALIDAEKLREARADIGDDEFCDWWEEFSTRIPGELIVEDMGDNVDLEGDEINLEKLYEIDMEARRKQLNNNNS